MLGRKMAGVAFAISGLMLSLEDVASVVHPANFRDWLNAVLVTFVGILFIATSVGIWMRRLFGWYIGFALPLIVAVLWLPTAFSPFSRVGNAKTIVEILQVVFSIYATAGWPFYWKRRRGWFESKTEKIAATPPAA